jgi:hypothetical protein
MKIPNHTECAAILHKLAAEQGADVTVSDQPPMVPGPYTRDGFVCAHGTAYWIEPTGEQIAQWTADGTP